MKKEEMRFSIRFNPADPRHRKAAQILNQAGRSKAIIVANALWEYELKNGALMDISNSHEGSATITSPAPDSQRVPIQSETMEQSDNDKIEDGLQYAILAGLSQFRDDEL